MYLHFRKLACILIFIILNACLVNLSATTYTVINTNDSGPGSLRQAMTDAAATSAADIIEFNIPGTAPHVISIGTATTISLPQMNSSGGQLTIDGTTQPANGYTGNSPKIILDGTSVTTGSDQDGLNLWGTGSEVYGLFIRNFPHHGIAMAADNGIIGGVGKTNVISGNGWNGVYIFIVTNSVIVQSNLIGVQPDSVTAFGNGDDGVHVWQSSDNNVIGGAAVGQGNILAYNDNGVYVRSGIANRISHNSIFCNMGKGIRLSTFSPGGNNNYPAPTITAANTSGANGTANPNDIIELFQDDNCSNCEGKTFIVTVIADAQGNWSHSGALSGTITANATGFSTDNTSEFSSCMVVVGPPVPPVASFVGDSTVFCPGYCVNFSDQSTGAPVSWSWSFHGGNPAASTAQNPGNVCYDSAGTYAVTLVATNAGGSDTSSVTSYITVNSLPTADAGSDEAICIGDSVVLTASGGTGFLWSPGGQTSSSITVAPAIATQYAVQVTDGNGCANTDSVNVSVNALPTIWLGNDTSICTICTVTLDAGNPGGTYIWSTGATGQTLVVDSTGLYWVTITDGNGCMASDSIFVDATLVGNEEPLKPEINVYPNPAQERIYLECLEPGVFELYDLQGRRLQSIVIERVGKHLLDLSDVAQGVVMYRFVGEGTMTTGRIVLEQ